MNGYFQGSYEALQGDSDLIDVLLELPIKFNLGNSNVGTKYKNMCWHVEYNPGLKERSYIVKPDEKHGVEHVYEYSYDMGSRYKYEMIWIDSHLGEISVSFRDRIFTLLHKA